MQIKDFDLKTDIQLTERLVEEHKLIKRLIDVLENSIIKLEKGEKIDVILLEQATDFIRNFADKFHHAKEEEILFKEMIEKGMPEKDSPTEVMLIEHEQGRNFVKGIIKATDEQKKDNGEVIKEIITNARGYIVLLRDHIDKEDNILYPLAERMFTQEEKDEQIKRFDEAEIKKGGNQTVRKYKDLVEALEIEQKKEVSYVV